MRQDGEPQTWRDLITPEIEERAEAVRKALRDAPQGPVPQHVEDPDECTSLHHQNQHGPCTDTGQCPLCHFPVPRLRPKGETYGLHAEDCALPERHYGPCEHGGAGHAPGVVRGYWPGMNEDIARAREHHEKRTR